MRILTPRLQVTILMTTRDEELYFDWLCHFITDPRHSSIEHDPSAGTYETYSRLLHDLYSTDFYWTVFNDGNREQDGLTLRKEYPAMVELGDKKCSILEMMIALALRCEENIMDEPEEGNRTATWFWGMISNLGLGEQCDIQYRPAKTEAVLSIFLAREYATNGKGGLFTVHNIDCDMANIEIWYQMCFYLDELLDI